ncbi:hypothetical protein WMF15_42065 [Sorangium sp. So ce233]
MKKEDDVGQQGPARVGLGEIDGVALDVAPRPFAREDLLLVGDQPRQVGLDPAQGRGQVQA